MEKSASEALQFVVLRAGGRTEVPIPVKNSIVRRFIFRLLKKKRADGKLMPKVFCKQVSGCGSEGSFVYLSGMKLYTNCMVSTTH